MYRVESPSIPHLRSPSHPRSGDRSPIVYGGSLSMERRLTCGGDSKPISPQAQSRRRGRRHIFALEAQRVESSRVDVYCVRNGKCHHLISHRILSSSLTISLYGNSLTIHCIRSAASRCVV